MGEYTAEDFAQANLATRGDFGVARRTDPIREHQWHVYGAGYGWFTDEEMATWGWEPVVEGEAHDRAVTLLDTKKTHERTIAELRHDLKVALAEVADLGDENDRLERILQAPLSLKGLEVAWENAEVPTSPDFRDEDVVIVRNDSGLGGYFVRHAHDTIDLELWAEGAVRYLHRAPREPWADLADIIGRYDGDSDSPAGLARFLHENEVTTPFDRDAGRVTGGDE